MPINKERKQKAVELVEGFVRLQIELEKKIQGIVKENEAILGEKFAQKLLVKSEETVNHLETDLFMGGLENWVYVNLNSEV